MKIQTAFFYQRFNREALHRLNSGLINESQNNLLLFNKELRKACSLVLYVRHCNLTCGRLVRCKVCESFCDQKVWNLVLTPLIKAVLS